MAQKIEAAEYRSLSGTVEEVNAELNEMLKAGSEILDIKTAMAITAIPVPSSIIGKMEIQLVQSCWALVAYCPAKGKNPCAI